MPMRGSYALEGPKCPKKGSTKMTSQSPTGVQKDAKGQNPKGIVLKGNQSPFNNVQKNFTKGQKSPKGKMANMENLLQ